MVNAIAVINKSFSSNLGVCEAGRVSGLMLLSLPLLPTVYSTSDQPGLEWVWFSPSSSPCVDGNSIIQNTMTRIINLGFLKEEIKQCRDCLH